MKRNEMPPEAKKKLIETFMKYSVPRIIKEDREKKKKNIK